MGEALRVGPQQVAAGQVGLGQVRIERQRLFRRRERLLVEIARLLGRDEGQPRDVRRGQVGVGSA